MRHCKRFVHERTVANKKGGQPASTNRHVPKIHEERNADSIARREGKCNMTAEERTLFETLVYSYLISEMGMMPLQAREKIESMTDKEIESFLE